MIATLRTALVLLGLLGAAAPAYAQWSRVLDVPDTDVFSVWANGDTVVAGADSVVYVSTDAGATWSPSARVAAGATAINAALIRNGRLYAGTYGQGVFVSDNFGGTWLGFSQGLVGGIANSQLFLQDLLVRGDSLYAATSGAGAWVRNLAVAGTWSHFGNAFEPNQASNMNGIAAGGGQLLACAGFNGTVFFRRAGDADWTLSWLDNAGIQPGLAALSAAWTGYGWVVGTNVGVFRSPQGQEPWEFTDMGFGTLFNVSFATRGRDLFASFGNGGGATLGFSRDDGATWQELETLPFTFVYTLALGGTDLYAARFDGLWRRSIADVSVPRSHAPAHLGFAIAGTQPVGDEVRFRFDLPAPGAVAIDLYDVAGRRAAAAIRGSWPAGAHELAWDARGLAAGIYHARLRAAGRQAVVRLVRVP